MSAGVEASVRRPGDAWEAVAESVEGRLSVEVSELVHSPVLRTAGACRTAVMDELRDEAEDV